MKKIFNLRECQYLEEYFGQRYPGLVAGCCCGVDSHRAFGEALLALRRLAQDDQGQIALVLAMYSDRALIPLSDVLSTRLSGILFEQRGWSTIGELLPHLTEDVIYQIRHIRGIGVKQLSEILYFHAVYFELRF